MLRKLVGMLLRVDLEPQITWLEAEWSNIVARIAVEVPRPFAGTVTREQVLNRVGDDYVLCRRFLGSGHVERVSFRGPLNGREMRLSEWISAPRPIYRLQLWPIDNASVTYDAATPTWLRFWRNHHVTGLGVGICFIDSANRDELRDLRFRLLDGDVPESLQNEEDMWQRIHNMSEADRRSAMATLTVQSLRALDYQFNEMHPETGSVPHELKTAFSAIQDRIRGIEHMAASRPLDPELEKQMQQLVSEATAEAAKRTEKSETGES